MPTVRVQCPSEQVKVRSVYAEVTVSRRGRAAGAAPEQKARSPRGEGGLGLSRWRCTRYVALHPLCGAAPEQKGCNAYGSGAVPLGTSESAVGVCRGDCVAQRGGLPRHTEGSASHSIHSPLFVSLVIHRGPLSW